MNHVSLRVVLGIFVCVALALAGCSTGSDSNLPDTLSIQEEFEGMGFVFGDERPNWGRNSAGDDWDALMLRSDTGVTLWLRFTTGEYEKDELNETGMRWNYYMSVLIKHFVPSHEWEAAYDWLMAAWARMQESERLGSINLFSDSRYFSGVLVEAWNHSGDIFELDRELTDYVLENPEGFWVAAFGESLSQQFRALSPSPELTRPQTRVGMWRDALVHDVVGVDREIGEGVDYLPDALPYGTVIETDGPAGLLGFGCRYIFIVGEPPYRDGHGINKEVRSKTTVRVPDRIDGEHVWQFSTLGCSPWRVVDPSLYEHPTPIVPAALAELHQFAQDYWSGPVYTCTVKSEQGACITYDDIYTAYIFFAINFSTRKMSSIHLNEIAGGGFVFSDSDPYTVVETCVYEDYEQWASATLSYCEEDSVSPGVGVRALSIILAREWPELLDVLER